MAPTNASAEGNRKAGFDFTLPMGLEAERVWLTEGERLTTLVAKDGRWSIPETGSWKGIRREKIRNRLGTPVDNKKDLPSSELLTNLMVWLTLGGPEERHYDKHPFSQMPSQHELDWVRPHKGKEAPPLLLIEAKSPGSAPWVKFADARPGRRDAILVRIPVSTMEIPDE